jgi:putative ABC transport system permease protein
MNWGNRLLGKKEADHVRAGTSEEGARRDAGGPLWAESTLHDVRFALRALRKSPGFTATAILTLALGVGANTAIFQLLDAVRLRSLPVSDPQALAAVQIKGGNRGFGISRDETSLTYSLWEQIRTHQQAFSGVFAWNSTDSRLGQGAQGREAQGLRVSGETFPVLGVPPIRGRLFTAEDDRPGCGTPGAVISYALWQSEFGGQDSAIGSKLVIEGHPTEVIGVTPPGFFGLEVGKKFDFAVPFCSIPAYEPGDPGLTRRDFFWLSVMGRLKPGWSIERASVQLDSISPGLLEATMPDGYSTRALETYRNFRLAAYPAGNGVSSLRKTYDTSLWLLLGITGLVLLIACANLANLMLARGSTREREMAVRLALGASRWRLIRQLLSEGLVLAFGGAILGICLASVLSRSIVRFLSAEGDLVQLDLSVDWRVLAFTAVVAVLTCVVFGLAPAFRSSRTAPGTALKAGGRGMTAGRGRFSFQRVLVVSQIAVSLVLLVGALLFVRSFWNLMTLDPGFREKGILVAFIELERLNLSHERYEPFARDLLEHIRSIPQVESAATSTHFPLSGESWTLAARVGEFEGPSKFTWVSPRYFETIQIPLLAGRDFNDRDTRTSPHVAVVNAMFVRKFLGGSDPIGKTLRTSPEPHYPETQYEIVGVVKDTKYRGLRDAIPPMCFAPAQQFPEPGPWAVVFIRSSSPPSNVMSAVRQELGQLNPEIGMEFRVFERVIQSGLVRERMMALLSGFFGALAALLAMIGLYGVISYIIATRRNEIGIRMALGASRGNIVGKIVRQTMELLGLGVGVGVLLSLAATRGAGSLLFGLQPNDPLTLVGAAAFLVAVALIASYVPARRASRIDPMIALRYE